MRTATPTRTDLRAAARVTSVEVDRPAAPGAPVRVRTSDDLLAARTLARGAAHAEVALVAAGAVLLGGDHVVLRVRVADGCTLTLTDVGGTVAYDGEGSACRWDVDVRLGDGARLDWHGLPLVVSTGADVTRATTVRLGSGACLLLRETVVLGRAGERGGRVVVRTDVADPVGPLLVEEVVASGTRPVPGILGTDRVLDTLTALGGSPDGLPMPPPVDGAVTLSLERGGTLTRWLGSAAHLSPLHRSFPVLDHPATGPTVDRPTDRPEEDA